MIITEREMEFTGLSSASICITARYGIFSRVAEQTPHRICTRAGELSTDAFARYGLSADRIWYKNHDSAK